MRFFGINHGQHDAGIACINEEGELLVFSQTERLTRRKSDSSVGFLNRLLGMFGIDPVGANDFFFTTWPNHYKSFFDKQIWPDEFSSKMTSSILGFDRQLRVHYLSHHLCHIATSWMFRDTESLDESLYIAIDGSGCRTDGSEGFYSIGVISLKQFQEHNNNLDKYVYSPHHRLNRIRLPSTSRLEVAGKLMGLSGYIPSAKFKRLPFDHRITSLNRRIERDGLTESAMIECASIYWSYTEDLKDHIRQILDKYKHKNVVVGGGAFLALELNTWLVEQGRNIIFGPPINDSGIALGSAAYGYFLAKGEWPRRLDTPYLQWCPQFKTDYISPQLAALYLMNGEILGLITGKGEAGPRALGNRSLLAVPTMENARKASMEIKGREFYRPLAPIVTERCFDNLFIGPKGRHMQFRNFCTEHAKILAPGIVHKDNTARVQVLDPCQHPWLYELLVEIGKKTGVECLINTSLNAKGMAICNTLEDAIADFSKTNVRLVSL